MATETTRQADRLRVHVLAGEESMEWAPGCLASLTRFASEPVQLVIHDDGSLSPASVDALETVGGSGSVLRRRAADEIVDEMLASRPALRSWRQREAFALKLVDAPLIEEGDVYYCDTDILFYRPFEGIHAELARHGGVIHMRDAEEGTSIF